MTEPAGDYPSRSTVWRAIVIYIVVCVLTILFAVSIALAETLEDVVTSPKTFAVCKTLDITSTAYLLEHGLATEANPLVAWSLKIGGYAPLVFVSIGIYWAMEKYKEVEGAKTGTAIANGVTCGVALKNLALIP
jgi:hypothetical protein